MQGREPPGVLVVSGGFEPKATDPGRHLDFRLERPKAPAGRSQCEARGAQSISLRSPAFCNLRSGPEDRSPQATR